MSDREWEMFFRLMGKFVNDAKPASQRSEDLMLRANEYGAANDCAEMYSYLEWWSAKNDFGDVE